MLYNNPVRKKQWFASGEAPFPTLRPSLTIKKVLLCVWRNFSGIISYELFEPGLTLTATGYCEQLEQMKQKLIKNYLYWSIKEKCFFKTRMRGLTLQK